MALTPNRSEQALHQLCFEHPECTALSNLEVLTNERLRLRPLIQSAQGAQGAQTVQGIQAEGLVKPFSLYTLNILSTLSTLSALNERPSAKPLISQNLKI